MTTRPWRSSATGRSSPTPSVTTLRRTHSKVVLRQASATRSSSPGSGERSMPSGSIEMKSMGVAPAANSCSSTSGCRSRSRLRSLARKAWEWRTCGAPRRSQSNAPCGSAGSGVSSCSTSTTWWPARPADSATPSPPIPAPITAIRATCPVPLSSRCAVDRRRPAAGPRTSTGWIPPQGTAEWSGRVAVLRWCSIPELVEFRAELALLRRECQTRPTAPRRTSCREGSRSMATPAGFSLPRWSRLPGAPTW